MSNFNEQSSSNQRATSVDALPTRLRSDPLKSGSSDSSQVDASHGLLSETHQSFQPTPTDLTFNSVMSDLSTAGFVERMSYLFGGLAAQHLTNTVDEPESLYGDLCRAFPEDDASTSLSRTEQSYLLGLFARNVHRSVPILDMEALTNKFELSWANDSADLCEQQACPLLEIVLALSMQLGKYGRPQRPVTQYTTNSGDLHEDPSFAGFPLFRRCHARLFGSLESPKVETLQACVLCVIYSRHASLSTTAYQLLGHAVRTAYVLGWNKKIPDIMPKSDTNIRQRIWWLLRFIDMEQYLDFGRPFALQHCDRSHCRSDTAGLGRNEKRDYFVQLCELASAAMLSHQRLFRVVSRLGGIKRAAEIHQNAETLEACAVDLASCQEPVRSWADHVPPDMLQTRKSGQAFSTDLAPIEVDTDSSHWLQRQRLSLELWYHKAVMGLNRVFIASEMGVAHHFATLRARACLNEAFKIIETLHQALMKMDVLNGWYDAHFLLWEATLSVLGFISARPSSQTNAQAHVMLNTATSIFDVIGTRFTARVAMITRHIKANAIRLAEHHNQKIPESSSDSERTSRTKLCSLMDDTELSDVSAAGIGESAPDPLLDFSKQFDLDCANQIEVPESSHPNDFGEFDETVLGSLNGSVLDGYSGETWGAEFSHALADFSRNIGDMPCDSTSKADLPEAILMN